METNEQKFSPLKWWKAALLVLGAAACFHAAYTPAHSGPLALLIVGYVVCVVQLARLATTRQSFYAGLLTGLACYAPQLAFFWGIFGPAAITLWTVLAFWLALFVALAHVALARFGVKRAVWLIPFLWTGLEYFRSELYYLKFAWLNVGFAFAESSVIPWLHVGVYGLGFAVTGWSSLFLVASVRQVLTYTFAVIAAWVIFAFCFLPTAKLKYPAANFRVAGVQLECPDSNQIIHSLVKVVTEDQRLVANHIGYRPLTNVDLIVLPEYTLDGPPTEQLKNWCRENRKFLIVGGKDPAPNNNFYDSAFVISTNGEVVFKQAKSIPIQFFKDGLPAKEQRVWESPWGKIGICICYDLSYARVTDELVRQGAQMLIVPTMDVADWGRHQHELHARVAPVRAAEYGIPIFRVASSGISQGVNGMGYVRASAPFPGDGEVLFFGVNLRPDRHGSLPLDRWLAPLCVGVTGLFGLWLAVENFRRKRAMQPRGRLA